MYKLLIVEDDIEIADILRKNISDYSPEFEIGPIAHSLEYATLHFTDFKPHILMLDISINNELIFSFLDSVNTSNVKIIFLSSYANYGVKAIEYQPFAYLLKPYENSELCKILNQLLFSIQNTSSNTDIPFKPELRFKLESIDKIEYIPYSDIIYLESSGPYTTIVKADMSKSISSKNLGKIEGKLHSAIFTRIHSKYLININYIKTIHKKGQFYVELQGNIVLPVSRSRKENLLKIIDSEF